MHKRCLLLVFVLIGMFGALPAHSAVAWQKATPGIACSSTPCTLSYTPHAAGEILTIKAFDYYGTPGAGSTGNFSISGGSQVYTVAIAKVPDTTNKNDGEAWWTTSLSTSPFTISVAYTGSISTTSFNLYVDDWSGADPVNPIDATNSGIGTSSTPSISVTVKRNNDGLEGALWGSFSAVGSGFTVGANDGNGDATEHKILSGGAGAGQTVNFTQTGTSSYMLLGIALKPAGGMPPAVY